MYDNSSNSYKGIHGDVLVLMEFTSTSINNLSEDHLETFITEELMSNNNNNESNDNNSNDPLIIYAIISRDSHQEKVSKN